MQKKLLVAAVLSAFAGAASAQSANVTLYGTWVPNFESASATGADSSTTAGVNSSTRSAIAGGTTSVTANPQNQGARSRNNPAGTNFGIRGTEDLGNGLSAWFQMEMAVQSGNTPPNAGSTNGTGVTNRNTGVGLRSNTWGTALIGLWDTPFNQMYAASNINGRTGGPATVLNANLMGGNTLGAQGAYSGQSVASFCATAAACVNYGTQFDRRDNNQLQWWSPNWNGFELKASYNYVGDSNINTSSARVGGALKPTSWGLSGSYTNGPLMIGYAYERHNDRLAYASNFAALTGGNGTGLWTIGTGASAASGSTGVGHRLGGRYTFALGGGSSLGLGALWESLKYDISYNATAVTDLTNLKKTAYRLQGNFATGNHFFGLEYVRANELKGSLAGNTAANSFSGGGTAARGIILSYDYMLSKRTSVGAYYVDIRNDSNAAYSGPVFGGIATAAGADPKYVGLRMRHAF